LACCAVGLKLISLHQGFKFDTIPRALKCIKHLNNILKLKQLCAVMLLAKNLTTSLFWTSATDNGCEDSFGYCSSKRLVREEAR